MKAIARSRIAKVFLKSSTTTARRRICTVCILSIVYFAYYEFIQLRNLNITFTHLFFYFQLVPTSAIQ